MSRKQELDINQLEEQANKLNTVLDLISQVAFTMANINPSGMQPTSIMITTEQLKALVYYELAQVSIIYAQKTVVPDGE